MAATLYAAPREKNTPLPAYHGGKNHIQKAVKDWMGKEKQKKEKKVKKVKVKTDALGRKVKEDASNQMAEEKLVTEEEMRFVMIADMRPLDEPLETASGRIEYNAVTGEKIFYLNDKKVSEKEYFAKDKKRIEKIKKRKKAKRNLFIPGELHSDEQSWTARMTAAEIELLLQNNTDLAVADYVEAQNTASRSSLLSALQLSSHAFSNGYNGSGIGVYMKELEGSNCVNPAGVNANKLTQVSPSTCTSYESHATGVAAIIQMAAPDAHVYAFQALDSIASPFSYSPPMEIGNHSYCYFSSTPSHPFDPSEYTVMDMKFDRHIFNYQTIDFVAAGNYGKCGSTYDVSSPGKALNAITVGAVDPATNAYASYSRHINSEVGNEKPEVAMYTNIDFTDNASIGYIFDGTSAATPLLAGLTASVLEQYPEYKRHPALMKAVIIAGSTMPIQNGNSFDGDNSIDADGVANFSSLAGSYRSRWWATSNNAPFNDNDEIVFTESNLTPGKTYRMAIAWLTPGEYILENKTIAQDLDLIITGPTWGASSTLPNSPHELMVLTAGSTSTSWTVKIRRADNSGYGNVILGYHFYEVP
jgi:hypothetical protein